MLTPTGNRARAGVRVRFAPIHEVPEPIPEPKVITIHMKSEIDMIMDLMAKLPAAPRFNAGGADQARTFMHSGVRPPPGLPLPDSYAKRELAAIGLHQEVGLPPGSIETIGDFAKLADGEQSSTNDDGERDPCESLPSEDEMAYAQMICGQTMPTGMTTLMVRNIPVMYTQDMLLLEWENKGAYDFLYLPRTGQTNLSYAFINFVSEVDAMVFQAQWHKKRLAHFTGRKPLNISFADVQGLEANLAQLKKKRLRRIELRQCQPLIIKDGRQLELAEALATVTD